MNEQERQRFEKAMEKVEAVYDWMQERKTQQISAPCDDASRKIIGVGFTGRTSDTVAAGGIIVDTNEGPVTLLHA